MKKFVVLLLILVTCFTLVACSNGGSNNGSDAKILSKEQLAEFIQIIEFTQENWLDYFYVETIVEQYTNAFGEVTSSDTFMPVRVKSNDAFLYSFYNEHYSRASDYIILECNNASGNKVTFEVLTEGYNMADYVSSEEHTRRLDDKTFDRSSCKLVLFNIPEEYLSVTENGDYFIYYQDKYTKYYANSFLYGNNITEVINYYLSQNAN